MNARSHQMSNWLFFPLLVVGPLILFFLAYFLIDRVSSLRSFSTEQAPGFSDENFALIRPGMSTNEVFAALGTPLHTSAKGPNLEWWFTSGKEPIDGMGSWDARYIIFSNGIAKNVLSHRILNH